MTATLRLKVITGPHRGERFCFRGRSSCTLGRATECFVRLFGDERDTKISRCHCQLDVNNSFVQINDLGSLNGTYINGHRLPGPPLDVKDSPTSNDLAGLDSILGHGDVLTVGGMSMQLELVDCPEFEGLDENDPSFWKPGETAKKVCAMPC